MRRVRFINDIEDQDRIIFNSNQLYYIDVKNYGWIFYDENNNYIMCYGPSYYQILEQNFINN